MTNFEPVKRNSTVKTTDGTNVVIQGVECLGFIEDEEINRIEKTDVVFQMATPESKISPISVIAVMLSHD